MDIKYTKDYYVVYLDEDYENGGDVFKNEELAYNYACDMHKSGHKVRMEKFSVADLDF